MRIDPVCSFSLTPERPEENISEIIGTSEFILERIHREFKMEMVEIFFIRNG